MKNSIIYLGLALVAFTNVSTASNQKLTAANEITNTVAFDGTPLVTAVQKGDIEVIKKFIEYGVNVNERAGDMSPLMMAARYNKVEIIKLLLAAGANVSDKNDKDFTALKYAELSKATEAIAILKDLK
ncbi:ankyrin repeat domain-containing protein [Flavobacterium artemisiae]|uniref:Ankyrin repeat domain-containing protein n=1 Tax=Flavobacterium artemisiae TaxID=2126556 RepID=A0ABW4HG10_9FLAO